MPPPVEVHGFPCSEPRHSTDWKFLALPQKSLSSLQRLLSPETRSLRLRLQHLSHHFTGKIFPVRKMTCGWCHREPAQHTLSTSGPTRCQYKTHRADCPGNFSTKCSDQLIEGVVAAPEVGNISENGIKDEKDETIRQLEQELAKLRVSGPAAPPSTPLGAPSLPPASSAASPHQSWGQAAAGILGADVERLARDHLSTNQQFLHSGTNQHGSSYSGPLISEIRKDPNVQMQADAILGAIKQTIPVFATPNAPNLAGINPLLTQNSSTPQTTLVQRQQLPLQQQTMLHLQPPYKTTSSH